MPTLIKNCGLKTPEAVAQAAATGASYIGLVHHVASPRHLSLAEGAALRAHIPTHVKTVAVLVAPDDALVAQICAEWQPDLLQIHGVTDATRLKEIRQHRPLILGWPVGAASDIIAADAYAGLVEHVLFDTQKTGSDGGTGEAFNWQWLATHRPALPWFLAGGLTPANVAEALRITRAPAVDVSSGLESAPGIKSLEKIAAFNEAVLRVSPLQTEKD